MPSRLYFANTAAPYAPSGSKGVWNASSSSTATFLLGAKTGTSATGVGSGGGVASTNYDFLIAKWISATLSAATISGTLTWVLGGLVSNTGFTTGYHKLHIWVSVGDSNTLRGTLLDNTVGNSIASTTAVGRASGTKTLTSVAVSDGDRLVVEGGTRNFNTSSSSRSANFYYGATGATDLVDAANATAVGTNPGWLEFSQTLTFGGGGGTAAPPGDFFPFMGYHAPRGEALGATQRRFPRNSRRIIDLGSLRPRELTCAAPRGGA